MNRQEIENELAYSWKGKPRVITTLKVTKGWKRDTNKYQIVDSIYDSENQFLAKQSMGVRIRSKGEETVLTAKRYIGEGESGESIFEEYNKVLSSRIHPAHIFTEDIGIKLKPQKLIKQLQFINNREEAQISQNGQSILLVNEEVTYANSNRTYTEHILEVEFKDVSAELIEKVRDELESNFNLDLFKEGKTDRARRFLAKAQLNPLIENINQVQPLEMSAHGGKGHMLMRFFHQPFNHFSNEIVYKKVIGFENSNWDFFGYACLPVGAEIKDHKHDETDEIYFIVKGSATMYIDDQKRVINKGDCILTRKGSKHSIKAVTKQLEFIAIEIR